MPFLQPTNNNTKNFSKHLSLLLSPSRVQASSFCNLQSMDHRDNESPSPVFHLKILIDKKKNQVVATETSKDFIDTLFSFLTLPLATIVRIVRRTESAQPQKTLIGSISNLYQSVENLRLHELCFNFCWQILLNPINPCELLCSRLRLNVDDTEPAIHYACDQCGELSHFKDTRCSCGKLMVRENDFMECLIGTMRGGVFVKQKGSMFLVFDNLKIVPSSLLTSMELLLQLGYTDLSNIEEVTKPVGIKEALLILKHAMTCNNPLSATFLKCNPQKQQQHDASSTTVEAKALSTPNIEEKKMEIKVIRSKSKSKIIVAEAKEDFVDFILSFLPMSLGSVMKLLEGNSNIECIDNLYRSVQNLDPLWSTEALAVLLNPGLAEEHGYSKQPLDIHEVKCDYKYFQGLGKTFHIGGKDDSDKESGSGEEVSTSSDTVQNDTRLVPYDPRSQNNKESTKKDGDDDDDEGGFVKKPMLFAVEDDLKVKPLNRTSCLSLWKELGVPLDDLQVRILSIGEREALSLLRASLTSKTALTNAFDDYFKDPTEKATPTTSKYPLLTSKKIYSRW